ncbi:MAG TPA: amidohydrolase family protein [Dehalococcoidia bacterium]|nr:amidohydrolase family protein [Dehalococcoidia bacterium]
MIIDFHTHISPPWVKENRQDYLRDDPCFAQLYSSPKAKIATADEVIASMNQAGVDTSVILNIGWASQEICARTNDYILEAVARYPDRLVGFCTIQPKAGEVAIREMERCARGGARGIGEMRPDVQGFDLGDKEMMRPFAEMAMRYHLLFLTHASEPVGHQYSGKGSVTPDILYRFIGNFPELYIICAHWGGGLPFYALMPEVASALANTFFDTAASPLLSQPQIFKQVVEIAGADKVLFGSDYPLITPSRIIAQIESIGLPQDVKAMIMGGNAQRLLEWSKSAVSSPLNSPQK